MESISRRRALAIAGGALLGATGVAATVGEATAATAWRRLVVVTANIGRDDLSQRETAIRDVRHAVDGADPLVGWQEIGEGDDDGREPAWINQYFGERYRNAFEYDPAAHRVPISVPREFNIADRRVTPVHGGKEGVSPNRVITEVVLTAADDPALSFVFANTHYVAGAWNGQEDPYEDWRDSMWAEHFRKHRDLVIAHWRAKGYPVIWTGDCNRDPMPLLLPNHEQRAFGAGIDQIAWIPGTNGTELRLNSTKVVPMHVDGHNARVAVMSVRRA
ncbi:hypothetical protein AB0I28_27935 [Phytomonospora sp. NPDC050363]|uniref:hypothetical protein n=1 Tax=Phytomonospora sp. NPDC050363 TaxID=3155642 RepID=UPI0033C2956C